MNQTTHALRRGFTIVELLIVIVVIGLLAVISIVVYTGIQSKAQASAAQEGLAQAKKKLALYQVENAAFPTSGNLSSAGISDGATTYQYTSDGSTYCITATNGSTSYYLNNSTTTSPTSGGCAGHGQGGQQAITNLSVNPRATSSYGGEWQTRYGMTGSYITGAGDGPNGITTYRRLTQPSDATGGGRGIDHRGNIDLATPAADSTWAVTAGQPFTASSYVRASISNTTARLNYRIHNGAGAWLTSSVTGPTTNYTAGNWVRLSVTFTPSVSGYVQFASRFDQSVTWTAGSTIDGTGLMITQGSTLYTFADGSSSNWIWNGTANNSTSTGPGN